MCIAVRVAAMFGCTSGSSKRCGNIDHNSRVCDTRDLVPADSDDCGELPPMSAPKLTRWEEASAPSRTAHSSSSAPTSPFPEYTERLKPSVFRSEDAELHFLASVRGDIEELAAWLSAGGCPNTRDTDGWSLLQHASIHGRVHCVELLLQYGASLDVTSTAGHTILHVASANRHCEVVASLVKAGATVDAQNVHGNTALHSAAATGAVDVVAFLLSHSADPDLVNSVGETADRVSGAGPEAFELLQEARRRKQARIAQWLALVNLNKLCSNGRAYPKTGLTLTGLTITAKNEAAERTSGTFQSESLADNFNERASLEATVAGVAALPEEVLRRLVAFCSL